MPRQESLKCRLCLGSGGPLTNIFCENDDAEQLVREAIEELLELKVVREGSNPWFLCYQCFKIVTDFYMFKQQCHENNLILERQAEKKQEERNIGRSRGHLEDAESHMSSDEEINIKEEGDADIPQMVGRLEEEVLQVQDSYPKQDGSGENVVDTLLHVCQFCDKVFAQNELLTDHVMHIHLNKVKQFRCDVCSEVFEGKDYLSRHIKSVHALKKKYQCELCSRNFHHLSHLKSHMSIHTGKKAFKCALCLRCFRVKSNLRRHMLIHTDKRHHKCDVCSKGFNYHDSLKWHMMTHTGERPYRCDICCKGFIRKTILKAHMFRHTGAKPYPCKICSKRFSTDCELKKHIFIHTGEKPHT
ncbi:zinc finger protein 233-like [Hetaerina americana]|uniref:zinc finger protein 233-like n=1 Tax=Hetaerina americana TaxID=62018 RepID=UPI003A7F40C0